MAALAVVSPKKGKLSHAGFWIHTLGEWNSRVAKEMSFHEMRFAKNCDWERMRFFWKEEGYALSGNWLITTNRRYLSNFYVLIGKLRHYQARFGLIRFPLQPPVSPCSAHSLPISIWTWVMQISFSRNRRSSSFALLTLMMYPCWLHNTVV